MTETIIPHAGSITRITAPLCTSRKVITSQSRAGLRVLRNEKARYLPSAGSSADQYPALDGNVLWGHFPALEEPELLVEDIRLFFRALRS
jgi:hypothetical protein